jgi:hypothetical protein
MRRGLFVRRRTRRTLDLAQNTITGMVTYVIFSKVYVHSGHLPLTAPKTRDRHLGDPQCQNHPKADDTSHFRIDTLVVIGVYLQGVPLIVIERHGQVQVRRLSKALQVDLERSEIFHRPALERSRTYRISRLPCGRVGFEFFDRYLILSPKLVNQHKHGQRLPFAPGFNHREATQATEFEPTLLP